MRTYWNKIIFILFFLSLPHLSQAQYIVKVHEILGYENNRQKTLYDYQICFPAEVSSYKTYFVNWKEEHAGMPTLVLGKELSKREVAKCKTSGKIFKHDSMLHVYLTYDRQGQFLHCIYVGYHRSLGFQCTEENLWELNHQLSF